MRFEPLYHGDRLHVINPHGDVGLITLWSPTRATLRVLQQLSPALVDAEASRIAAVANLYGDGMHHMFANLLHNPQIRHLVAVGEQRGLPTVAELEAFLRDGVTASSILGVDVLRITGTGRMLPPMPGFDADRLREQIDFCYHGPIGRLSETFVTHLEGLPHYDGPSPERANVEIPPVDYSHRPSDTTSHQVTRRRVLDAWRELVTRVLRFGVPVDLDDRPRRELLNARIVITEPTEDDAADLDRYGFVLADLHRYQATMLDGTAPTDVAYTYGNRLRGYFPQSPDDRSPNGNRDALATVIALLRAAPRRGPGGPTSPCGTPPMTCPARRPVGRRRRRAWSASSSAW